MKSEFKINSAWRYTLINAMGGAIVGFIMALWAFNESALVFALSVFLGVAIVARLHHSMKMRNQTELTVKNYNSGAVSIGLLSHFTSFFIYVFLESFVMPYHGGFLSMSGRGVGEVIGTALFFGGFSMVFLFWVSIPLYMLMGFILRKIESKESVFEAELDMISEEK